MEKQGAGRSTVEKDQDMIDAKKNYKKMMERIRPYVKVRKPKQVSTTGEWKISSFRNSRP